MKETVFALLSIDTWTEFWWVIWGLSAQALFAARFVVQWIASERAGKSYVPVAFWYLSMGGGVTLLSYAIYRQDIVFILGQSIGLLVYIRNLALIRKEGRVGVLDETPAPGAQGKAPR